MNREEERNMIAHEIAWEHTKHYDPLLSKESWCEMTAREEKIKAFEQALEAAWKGYVERGAATVDALEENTQELAFAKGFKAGYESSYQRYEQGYKDAKEKAYKWLSEQMFELNACEEIYVADGDASSIKEFLNNFKQAMEGEQ